MLAKTRPEPIAATADAWLSQFEGALTTPGTAALEALFHPDSHWRDLLALTWTIGTLDGRAPIIAALKAQAGRAKPSGFQIDPDRTAPRNVTRAGTAAIEAIFRFETVQGRGSGIVRLAPDSGGAPKAWTLLTALDELKGHEETVGRSRLDRTVVLARFPRSQLARSPKILRRIFQQRSGGPGRRRRPGRAFNRGASQAIAGRHAGRRSVAAHRRQLA